MVSLYKQSNTYVGHLEPQEVKRRQKSVSTHNITWVTLEEQNRNAHCHETLKCYKRTGWLDRYNTPRNIDINYIPVCRLRKTRLLQNSLESFNVLKLKKIVLHGMNSTSSDTHLTSNFHLTHVYQPFHS